jgi:hypothetical protein
MNHQHHRAGRARFATLALLLLPALVGTVGCAVGSGADDDPESLGTGQDALLGVAGITYYYDATPRNTVDICYSGLYLWDGTTTGTVFNGSWTNDLSSVTTEISIMNAAIKAQWGDNSGLLFQFHDTCPSPIPAQYIPLQLVTGHWVGHIGGSCGWGLGSRGTDDPNLTGVDPEHQGTIFVYDDGTTQVRNQLREVAVHELGHGIGFAHEMDRSDWTANPTYDCTPGGASNVDLFFTDDYDPNSIMNYCRDTNNDGHADGYRPEVNERLTDLDKAGVQMVYGFPNPWSMPARKFCTGGGDSSFEGRLLLGKFNGDQRTDLLCYEPPTGTFTEDLADASGHFTANDWSRSGASFCSSNGVLVVADADGNGRDDIVCNERTTGRLSVDFSNASGQFLGADWSQPGRNFCANGTLVSGKFNADARSDLLCSSNTGLALDLADPAGHYASIEFTRGGAWCRGSSKLLLVGDVNGDGLDDLVCHDHATGVVNVDLAIASGQFNGADWNGPSGFCVGTNEHPIAVDMDGDNRVDLVCQDRLTGHLSVARGTGQGGFTEVKVRGAFARFCGSGTSAVYPGHFRGNARGDLLCFDHGGDLGAQYSTLPVVAGACTGGIGAGCLTNWRSTTCGQTCTSQTQSDRRMCSTYLDCYAAHDCGPSSCGSQDDVCGVNKLGGGMAPKTIADQVYACLANP